MDRVSTLLTQIVSSGDAVAAGAGLADAALQHVFPAIAEVPGIGTLISAIGGVRTAQNRLLVSKLGKFLIEQSEVTEWERYEFRAKLDQDPSFREEVGEHLLLLLERLDHSEKARLAGKLFTAFVKQKIAYDEYLLAAGAIDRAHFADIIVLARDGSTPHGDYGARLFAAGLTTVQVISLNEMRQLGLRTGFQVYPLNEVGEIVLRICYPHFEQQREATREARREPA